MSTSLRLAALAVPLIASLAACGENPGERALTGGLIGAGGGAALGATTGLGIVPGVVIGGIGGAVLGAATTPSPPPPPRYDYPPPAGYPAAYPPPRDPYGYPPPPPARCDYGGNYCY
jgi:hypothetical protein